MNIFGVGARRLANSPVARSVPLSVQKIHRAAATVVVLIGFLSSTKHSPKSSSRELIPHHDKATTLRLHLLRPVIQVRIECLTPLNVLSSGKVEQSCDIAIEALAVHVRPVESASMVDRGTLVVSMAER